MVGVRDYPIQIRRVVVKTGDGRRLAFLTNNMTLPPEAVSDLYLLRWRVELFFKWIKQHLRIKVFYGTSENAVKAQLWCAIATYALLVIVKAELGLKPPIYTLAQGISLSLFEKTPIFELFPDAPRKRDMPDGENQLVLW